MMCLVLIQNSCFNLHSNPGLWMYKMMKLKAPKPFLKFQNRNYFKYFNIC